MGTLLQGSTGKSSVRSFSLRCVIRLLLINAGALLLLLSATPSCSRKETGFETQMIDGVKVVRNLALKTQKGNPRLVFSEEVSIGGDDDAGGSLFYTPVDIDSDAEGNIYVLDSRDAVVRIFDRRGSLTRTIGRKGQGPGEFESPICMDVSADGTIVVVDQSLMRLTTMARNGDFVRSNLLKEYISDIKLVNAGTLVAGYSEPQTSRACVGLYEIDTGQMTPLFSQETFWPARLMNNELAYDFPYFVRFALGAQARLYAGSGVAYEITAMSLAGRIEVKFRKDQERIPVQGEMLDRISNMTLRGSNPYARNPHFPFFESLSVDERGRIWVQHYLPKISNLTNPETPYDVFSPEGIFLFEARIPGHISSKPVFKSGFLYALRKIESGYVRAIRLKVRE
ncbi:MAG TPA: 6-bladed beta-propeller [Acidobacteriota bacterium]|nr:6-bladed beta-propeller [Acidobacteriota bacterium]